MAAVLLSLHFLPADDLLLTAAAIITVVVPPVLGWVGVRFRKVRADAAQMRAELGAVREELAGVYGTLMALRESSSRAAEALAAGSPAPVTEALRAERAATPSELHRLTADALARHRSRPDLRTPH